MTEEGVRLESQRYEIVSTPDAIRPLRDYLLLECLDWQPSRTIQIAGNTRRTLRGKVIARGPGCYPKRYNRERSKSWDSKSFRFTAAKIGDIVELGGLQFDGYSFAKLLIENRAYLLCRDEDICAIVENTVVPHEITIQDYVQAVYA